MPYVSDKQRAFMWSQHPEIARKWAKEGHGYVKGKGSYDRTTVVEARKQKG